MSTENSFEQIDVSQTSSRPPSSTVNNSLNQSNGAKSATDQKEMLQAYQSIHQAHPEQGGAKLPPEGTPAYRRFLAWHQMRAETLQQLRSEKEKDDNKECTFQPAVPLAAARTHSNTSGTRTPRGNGEREAQQHQGADRIEDRLYHRHIEHEQQLRQMRQEKEKLDAQQCTFHPEVHYHPSHDTRSRSPYEQRLTQSWQRNISNSHREELSPKDDPECTFHPKIAPVSNSIYQTASRMEEGKMDVFSRLYSRSNSAKKDLEEGKVSPRENDDGSSFLHPQSDSNQLPPALSSELETLRTCFGATNTAAHKDDAMLTFFINVLGRKDPPLANTNVTLPQSQEAYQDPHSPSGIQGASPILHQPHNTSRGGNDSVIMNFEDFLKRQMEKEKEKRMNKKRLERQYGSSFKPALCDESLKMASEHPRRSLSSSERRKKEAEKQEKIHDMEPILKTYFKPHISHTAQKHSPRTDDQRWKEGEMKLQRLKILQDQKQAVENKEMTFKPFTNRNYGSIESVLANNLNGYREHIEARREAARQRQGEQDRQKKEVEQQECTFKPLINRTPGYISRMAQSFSLVRDNQMS